MLNQILLDGRVLYLFSLTTGVGPGAQYVEKAKWNIDENVLQKLALHEQVSAKYNVTLGIKLWILKDAAKKNFLSPTMLSSHKNTGHENA